MNFKYLLTTILSVVFVAVSAQNENANTSDNAYAKRLEMPQLRGGTNNLFIVHEVPEYGVNYALEWNCRKKAQRWSAYQWYKQNSVKNWNRGDWSSTEWGGDPFQEDMSIPSSYRSTAAMHQGNGYDRGHIVASADRVNSKDANEQTFFYSNMQPQVHNFNAGLWEKMEAQLRNWNIDSFRDTLYIVKGGTIDHDGQILEITDKGLLVPKYFFMGVLCVKDKKYKALGFWAEHKENIGTTVAPYAVTIDKIEEMTGLDLFCNLPDEIEAEVEASLDKKAWGLTDDGSVNPDLDETIYPALDDNLDLDDVTDDDGKLWTSTIDVEKEFLFASYIENNAKYYVMGLTPENKTTAYIPAVGFDTEEEITTADAKCNYSFENTGKENVFRLHDSQNRYLYMEPNLNTISLNTAYSEADNAYLWNVEFDNDGFIHVANMYNNRLMRYGLSKYGYGVYKSSGTLPKLYEAVTSSGIETCVHTREYNKVYTIDGQIVDFTVSQLPRGIYIIHTEQGTTKKIIIRR